MSTEAERMVVRLLGPANKTAMSYHQGLDVYHWPEFKALAKRLGIDHEWPTTDVVIRIPVEGAVSVEHTFLASDRLDNPMAGGSET